MCVDDAPFKVPLPQPHFFLPVPRGVVQHGAASNQSLPYRSPRFGSAPNTLVLWDLWTILRNYGNLTENGLSADNEFVERVIERGEISLLLPAYYPINQDQKVWSVYD